MIVKNCAMKNKIFYTILIITMLSVFKPNLAVAQQEPQYSQYMFNMMSVNPAYTGTREALNALLLSRIQWVGLDGAPRSHTFALHTPIQDKKIGIGASVISDNIGPVTNTYVNLNYAHRVKLNNKVNLSMGIKGGFSNYYARLSKLSTGEQDDSFNQDFSDNFQPNFGVGAYLYSPKYYVGISVPRLIQTNLKNTSVNVDVVSELKRHYFITAGYVFDVNSEWKIKSSLFNKIVEGAPPSFDITAQAIYNDKFWLGTTYRIGDALVALFEMQVNRQLVVGYSYDITLSGMSRVSDGSHEILISYDFAGFTNNKVKSPRYF